MTEDKRTADLIVGFPSLMEDFSFSEIFILIPFQCFLFRGRTIPNRDDLSKIDCDRLSTKNLYHFTNPAQLDPFDMYSDLLVKSRNFVGEFKLRSS